jgi:anti-sigma regulatory factor (Ser/Thr protein kinase)
VGLNARHAPGTPVRLSIADDPARLTLTVTDVGPMAGRAAGELSDLLTGPDAEEVADPDVALAVLTGLVDEVDVDSGAGGTTVTMRWPLPVGAAAGATVLSQS